MKSHLLILFFTSLSVSAFSQPDNLYKNKSLSQLSKKPAIKLNTNIKKLPVADSHYIENEKSVLRLKSTGEHKGNNGDGADIYVYSPDNMPVLKPDATFKSSMPVAGKVEKEKIKP